MHVEHLDAQGIRNDLKRVAGKRVRVLDGALVSRYCSIYGRPHIRPHLSSHINLKVPETGAVRVGARSRLPGR